MKTFRVCITCDGDPDQATLNSGERKLLTWKGLAFLSKASQLLTDNNLRLTLFFRIDFQIQKLFSNPLGLLKQNHHLISSLGDGEHEWGWHPHLFTSDNIQPLRNEDIACEQLEAICYLINMEGYFPKSVRLGEGWHSNKTMACLDRLGFTIDSTALPGRIRQDDLREFNWEGTPNFPYHPSCKDYRIPDKKNHLRILEVPMSTTLIKTSYDAVPLHRYISLSYRKEIFEAAVNSYLDSTALHLEGSVLVVIFHPGELLEIKSNDLYDFGWENFKKNVVALISILESRKIQFTSNRLSDVSDFKDA